MGVIWIYSILQLKKRFKWSVIRLIILYPWYYIVFMYIKKSQILKDGSKNSLKIIHYLKRAISHNPSAPLEGYLQFNKKSKLACKKNTLFFSSFSTKNQQCTYSQISRTFFFIFDSVPGPRFSSSTHKTKFFSRQ